MSHGANVRRANRAAKALEAYREGEPLADEEALADLLVDLRELALHRNIDWSQANDRAQMHYRYGTAR